MHCCSLAVDVTALLCVNHIYIYVLGQLFQSLLTVSTCMNILCERCAAVGASSG